MTRTLELSVAGWRFEVYEDSRGNYRWRLWSANNKKVATSGEAFYARSDAKRAAERVKARAGRADLA